MRLSWDNVGERFYETGVDHGVLYTSRFSNYDTATAWNGLTAVTESPSGAEPTDLYADNIKYLTMRSAETFGATVECYTYPKEWAACNGEAELMNGVTFGQQARESFGLSYRTIKGNDVKQNDYGYKLHLVYGCSASPSEKSYSTVNDSPEAITFSYEISTTPVVVDGLISTSGKPMKAVATITLDSTILGADAMKAIEDVLYGTAEKEGRLPMPAEIEQILASVVEPEAKALDGKEQLSDLGNKKVEELQKNVVIDNKNNTITGQLLYVESWSEFSSVPSEQSGNYLALGIDSPVPGATIDVELTTKATLQDDRQIVIRVTDATKKKPLKVTITESDKKTKHVTEYDISSLYLDTKVSK